MNWYLDTWIRYTQFSGRASREAFWMFMVVKHYWCENTGGYLLAYFEKRSPEDN
jgi:hypothetical protein